MAQKWPKMAQKLAPAEKKIAPTGWHGWHVFATLLLRCPEKHQLVIFLLSITSRLCCWWTPVIGQTFPLLPTPRGVSSVPLLRIGNGQSKNIWRVKSVSFVNIEVYLAPRKDILFLTSQIHFIRLTSFAAFSPHLDCYQMENHLGNKIVFNKSWFEKILILLSSMQ